MNVKITKQFAHSKEILIAALSNVEDARIFISAIEASNKEAAIYRLYIENKFINDSNIHSIPFSAEQAQFANQNQTLPNINNPFHVTAALLNTTEETLLAEFMYLNDAKAFAEKKRELSSADNINMIYYLYDDKQFLEEYNWINKKTAPTAEPKTKNVFRPTPFLRKLRLGPGNFW